MKAMILHKFGRIEDRPLTPWEIACPEPRENEILVKIQACGICHTDLHIVEGELPLIKTPVIPGHQVVGIVQGGGPGASRFKRGDPVGIPWLNFSCGRCEACHGGNENLCPNARFTGYHVDGGYAEFTVVSEEFACPIPRGYAAEDAAPLLCAGIIGYRALRRSGLQTGEKIGLFGFGASAHIVAQIARHWGNEVYAFTRSRGHQDLARSLGATWAGSAQDTPPDKLHRAILFAPAGRLVLNAMSNLRPGGTLSIAAIYLDRIPEMDYDTHLYGEKTIRSVTASTRQDAAELLALAPEIPIRTMVQTFPLNQANEALNRLKQGRINGAGVLTIGNDKPR